MSVLLFVVFFCVVSIGLHKPQPQPQPSVIENPTPTPVIEAPEGFLTELPKTNYHNMTIREIYSHCKGKVKNYKRYSKTELIGMLESL